MDNLDIKAIIGTFISLIILIGFVGPVFVSLFSSMDMGGKQAEIDKLNNEIGSLKTDLASKQLEIDKLNSIISSMDSSISEKDDLIANLSGEISLNEEQIANLTEEIKYYEEKKYLQDINNNYYNISNYFEKIEKKFFPIEIQLSLVSIALITVIGEVFGIRKFVIKYWKKVIKKEEHHTHTKIEVKK